MCWFKDKDTEFKVPEGKFLVVAFRGDRSFVIGVSDDIHEAKEVAHEERCVGVNIEIYDDNGRMS